MLLQEEPQPEQLLRRVEVPAGHSCRLSVPLPLLELQ